MVRELTVRTLYPLFFSLPNMGNRELTWVPLRLVLTVHPFHFPTLELAVQNKVLGEDKGILWNGVPIATMSKHKEFEHIKRRELVCVAPGMDVLLALGIACCRIDKNNKETADMLEVIGGM